MKCLKCLKLVAIAALCLAGWPNSSEAGLLFHRGCTGGQASAGCHGKQASAGCVGQQASAGCVGAMGHGRYREVHRFRGRTYSYVQPSAPVAPPVNPPQPMPKNQSAALIETPTIQAVSRFDSTPTRQELDARAQGDALEEVNAARSQQAREVTTAGTEGDTSHSSIRRESSAGDSAFLSVIVNCSKRRSELLGLDAAKKTHVHLGGQVTCDGVVSLTAEDLAAADVLLREAERLTAGAGVNVESTE